MLCDEVLRDEDPCEELCDDRVDRVDEGRGDADAAGAGAGVGDADADGAVDPLDGACWGTGSLRSSSSGSGSGSARNSGSTWTSSEATEAGVWASGSGVGSGATLTVFSTRVGDGVSRNQTVASPEMPEHPRNNTTTATMTITLEPPFFSRGSKPIPGSVNSSSYSKSLMARPRTRRLPRHGGFRFSDTLPVQGASRREGRIDK